MSSSLVILFGVVMQFGSSESGQKQSVKFLQYMVYSTIQPSPPSPVHLVWEGGREVREKIEGQQYTSIVPSSMGATVHKLGRK